MAKTLGGQWDQGNYKVTLLLGMGTHFCRTEEGCLLPEHRLGRELCKGWVAKMRMC